MVKVGEQLFLFIPLHFRHLHRHRHTLRKKKVNLPLAKVFENQDRDKSFLQRMKLEHNAVAQ